MTETPTAADQVKAAPGSLMASLRDRRQQAEDKLFLDLPIPRYDPPIFARFKPIEQSMLVAGQKRIEAGRKDKEIAVRVNAGYLAQCCTGLFEIIDGEKLSIDPDDRSTNPADWLTFGPELAEMLGKPLTRADGAAGAVRALYLTDGDIIATAAEVSIWSGYAGEQLDTEVSGN